MRRRLQNCDFSQATSGENREDSAKKLLPGVIAVKISEHVLCHVLIKTGDKTISNSRVYNRYSKMAANLLAL